MSQPERTTQDYSALLETTRDYLGLLGTTGSLLATHNQTCCLMHVPSAGYCRAGPAGLELVNPMLKPLRNTNEDCWDKIRHAAGIGSLCSLLWHKRFKHHRRLSTEYKMLSWSLECR